jgi:hypothetical protein
MQRNRLAVFAVVVWCFGLTAAAADAPTEQQAVAALKQLGGVLVHYNDRLPDRPVILVDFTNNQQFQDDWLKHLAAFPHLTGVGLSGTALSDAGLRHLKRIAQLETLTLAETKVTDQGLAQLAAVKTLKNLDVRGTQVSAAAVEVLRKQLPNLEVTQGDVPNAASSTTTESPAPSLVPRRRAETPSVQAIAKLREKAVELSMPGENDRPEPEGWSKSRFDPTAVVKLFKPLAVRKGFVLRAYTFRDQGNGNSVVWAMPADAEFPEPADCPRLENHLFNAPKPVDALDDVMEAIEGDDSPQSYLMASLLRRELREFGAMWHGVNWGTHYLLDADPWKAGKADDESSSLDRPPSAESQWKWLEPKPTHWGPQVQVEKDRVTVTFHTYSGLHEQSIYRHTDVYRAGKYRPRVEQKKIGAGPAGYAF